MSSTVVRLPAAGIFEFKILRKLRKSFRFTAGHKKDIPEGLGG
jgi:hypothetical protein